jgi:putative peptide zinc metalloprotease protein
VVQQRGEEGVIDAERVVLTPQADPRPAVCGALRLADGIELIGEYRGSGFQEPKYILRRSDGQLVQLSQLLYLLAADLDGRRDLDQLAARLSDTLGRGLAAEQVAFLLDNRLRPAGVLAVSPADGGGAAPARPDPLLALRFRVAVVPERVVWRIAGFFRSFFWIPTMLIALGVFVTLDMAIVARGGLGQVGPSALVMVHHPELNLLVLLLVLMSAMFHECGHVAACRYGGARPGRMGFGLYLVWPALYSMVTDAYRLGRGGRLRTDLGGVYFNAIFIAGMSLVYLGTGAPWLLIAILVLHVETIRQFMPMIRLDGYYILSDLVGVPDLFSRLGPVLKSMVPGRGRHPRVQELKPWVRRVITAWVCCVVPFLLYFFVSVLIVAPRVLPVVWHQLGHIAGLVEFDVHHGNLATATLGLVQMILLVLPWIGVALIFFMMGRRLVLSALARAGRTRSRESR